MEDEKGNFHSEKNGRFVPKGGREEKLAQAEQIYDSDYHNSANESQDEGVRTEHNPKPPKKGKSQEDFFGEEFTGVKGGDAIEKLLKEKRGHVKSAFERPEIGGIDLVWGDDTGGLRHTIMRRDKQLKDGTGTTSGIDMARKIPEIIEKGTFSMGENGRPNLVYHDFRVIVSPTFDGKKVNWVVSAMEPQIEMETQKKV